MPFLAEKRKYQRYSPSIQERATLAQNGYTWVLSSNVSAVAQFGNDLYIRFLNGSVYRYFNKANDFEKILAAASKGKWVWRFLRRPNVPYEKVGSLPLDSDLDVTDEELFEDVTRIPIEDISLVTQEQLDVFNALTVGLINTSITTGANIATAGLVFGEFNTTINLL